MDTVVDASADATDAVQRAALYGPDDRRQSAAILYSVMGSAKSNQVEPFAYGRDLLERLSGERTEHLAELLPHAWLKRNPEARRRWSR